MDIVRPDPDDWLADWKPCIESVVAVARAQGKDVDFLTLDKGEDHYVFLYTDDTRAEMLKVICKFADIDDRELSLTWPDAGELTKKVRKAAVSGTKKTAVHLNVADDFLPPADTFLPPTEWEPGGDEEE